MTSADSPVGIGISTFASSSVDRKLSVWPLVAAASRLASTSLAGAKLGFGRRRDGWTRRACAWLCFAAAARRRAPVAAAAIGPWAGGAPGAVGGATDGAELAGGDHGRVDDVGVVDVARAAASGLDDGRVDDRRLHRGGTHHGRLDDLGVDHGRVDDAGFVTPQPADRVAAAASGRPAA